MGVSIQKTMDNHYFEWVNQIELAIFNGYVGYIWGFPETGIPQNGWFIVENPIKMDELEVPIF
jgi:hypothetical protein